MCHLFVNELKKSVMQLYSSID